MPLYPYSLGILIEWKLRWNDTEGMREIYPYSLGILIEWKQSRAGEPRKEGGIPTR